MLVKGELFSYGKKGGEQNKNVLKIAKGSLYEI